MLQNYINDFFSIQIVKIKELQKLVRELDRKLYQFKE